MRCLQFITKKIVLVASIEPLTPPFQEKDLNPRPLSYLPQSH